MASTQIALALALAKLGQLAPCGLLPSIQLFPAVRDEVEVEPLDDRRRALSPIGARPSARAASPEASPLPIAWVAAVALRKPVSGSSTTSRPPPTSVATIGSELAASLQHDHRQSLPRGGHHEPVRRLHQRSHIVSLPIMRRRHPVRRLEFTPPALAELTAPTMSKRTFGAVFEGANCIKEVRVAFGLVRRPTESHAKSPSRRSDVRVLSRLTRSRSIARRMDPVGDEADPARSARRHAAPLPRRRAD